MQIMLNEAVGAFLGAGIAWTIFLRFLRKDFEKKLDDLTDRVRKLERK